MPHHPRYAAVSFSSPFNNGHGAGMSNGMRIQNPCRLQMANPMIFDHNYRLRKQHNYHVPGNSLHNGYLADNSYHIVSKTAPDTASGPQSATLLTVIIVILLVIVCLGFGIAFFEFTEAGIRRRRARHKVLLDEERDGGLELNDVSGDADLESGKQPKLWMLDSTLADVRGPQKVRRGYLVVNWNSRFGRFRY
ncbi:Fc.00g083650.m01.CDS01 [Cosmosporella sp. VM-42]